MSRKYKRNVLVPLGTYNSPPIELIEYSRRIGKKVYCASLLIMEL